MPYSSSPRASPAFNSACSSCVPEVSSSGWVSLPPPEPRDVRFTVVSVDDHAVEPRHMFEGRLPKHLQDRAPSIVETGDGHEVWQFEGQRHYQAGMNAVAGLRRDGAVIEPLRF